MRIALISILILASNLSNCQVENYDERIVKEMPSISIIEAPFMINKLLKYIKEIVLL